jgi:Ca2+-transporting ATPase
MGKLTNIVEDDLRHGDTVLLQAGDLVPADLKLVEATGLELDEFELTGEIMPVIKKVNGSDVIIYKGSKVIRGTGKGFVIATGEQTEYGRISKQKWQQKKDFKFHLINRKYFILVVLLLPALIISLMRYHNLGMVSAIFLPLAVIVVLLQNTQLLKYVLITSEIRKLEGRNIYFRDMTALEDFNNVDTICFDKTGVLTTRHIEVTKIYSEGRILDIDSVSTEENTFNLIKIACTLCNDVLFLAKIDQANPIDRALISFATKNGININETLFRYKRIYEKPFDSEERYMACGFELSDKKVYYFAKGDPEVILNMCKSYVTMSGIEKKVDFEFLSSIKTNIDPSNKKGDIIIALAYTSNASDNIPLNYTFLCLLQLENPLVPGVREIIRKLNEKGIRSIMLTGDRPNTAGKIGEEIGIANGPNAALTGRDIEKMELSEVARQSAYCSVFARLLPSQKGIIIRLFQQKGHYVAMVGDGANDSIALKVADIGISFVENSSPFAKRLSKILINDLGDLLVIVQGSKRSKWRVKFITWFRIAILITLLFALYMWVLNGNVPYQLAVVAQVVS